MKIKVGFEFDSPVYIETVSRIVEARTEDNQNNIDLDCLSEALYHLLYVAKELYEGDDELVTLFKYTADILYSEYEGDPRPEPPSALIFRPVDTAPAVPQ